MIWSQTRINKQAFQLGVERALGNKENIIQAEMSLMDRISEAIMAGFGINPAHARESHDLGVKVGKKEALSLAEQTYAGILR